MRALFFRLTRVKLYVPEYPENMLIHPSVRKKSRDERPRDLKSTPPPQGSGIMETCTTDFMCELFQYWVSRSYNFMIAYYLSAISDWIPMRSITFFRDRHTQTCCIDQIFCNRMRWLSNPSRWRMSWSSFLTSDVYIVGRSSRKRRVCDYISGRIMLGSSLLNTEDQEIYRQSFCKMPRQFAKCLGILQNTWNSRHFVKCLGF